MFAGRELVKQIRNSVQQIRASCHVAGNRVMVSCRCANSDTCIFILEQCERAAVEGLPACGYEPGLASSARMREAIVDYMPQPPVVLIVDDDPDALDLLQLFMQELAPTHDIIAVRDASDALHHLAQRAVPLVITDYMMPGLNGLQLTAATKAVSPMTHVILATAYGSAALEQRAREQGVDTVLPKVVLFDRLEDVVRSVLRLSFVRE